MKSNGYISRKRRGHDKLWQNRQEFSMFTECLKYQKVFTGIESIKMI
jgi:hypothetical protein